jgi:acetoin:2,6-dichlorophenolindophenol oxidoreductase subunit alpha
VTSPKESLDPQVLLSIFRKALLIQLVDERMRALLSSGRLAAVYYSPRGQEVLAAAMAVHLQPTDYLVTTYRGVHDQLAKGIPLRLLFAEYYGKASGACKGKGGPMHITHPATGIMVTTGVVGAGMPIANGLALASQLKGDGRVTLCNFGDGASNIGAFHEALNMASLWKLPVIFLCQNNGWGECTRYEKATAVAHVAQRAASYSMPGITVDGNDAQAMWRASGEAVRRARAGEGPTLLECKTYRFVGHSRSDARGYRESDEEAAWKERDPIPRLRAELADDAAAAIEAEVEAVLDDAVEFARASPDADPQEALTDVYA